MTMTRKFVSVSKRLSKHILIVFILAIILVSPVIISFARTWVINMTEAYFKSELHAINGLLANRRYLKATDAQLYNRMKKIDERINKYNPLIAFEINEQDNKDLWAYSIVIGLDGTYLYHPDEQRVKKGNFFDDIRQSSTDVIDEMTRKSSSGNEDFLRVTVNGKPSLIFYTKAEGAKWINVIIFPIYGLLYANIYVMVIILITMILGLMAAYWGCRFIIRRSIKPLQFLASSADEVARGNFNSPLPDLIHNDEISQLRDSFGNMQQSLADYIEQLKITTAQKAAIENDLSIAREIQMSMVPTVFPQRSDVDIYASMTPAKAVGGDLYDFFLEGDKLVFCIGDVSGKGTPAALFMMETRSLFRAYAYDDKQPDRIVSKINNLLTENNEGCMFVTLFVGVLDLTSGLLSYCNGGHVAPVIINQEAKPLPVRRVFPVGVYEESVFQTQTAVLEPHSTILFYTDGLSEAMDAHGQMFGKEQVIDVLNRIIQDKQPSSKEIIDSLTQAVHDFVGDTPQSDDLTMMAFKLK